MNENIFNKWAKTYNNDVKSVDSEYPFGGYDALMNLIDNINIAEKKNKVLDLGIGTGRISSILYSKGAQIYGVDFSENMIEECKLLMNDAFLYRYDLLKGYPSELFNTAFDYILSTYVFHHFDFESKISLIKQSLNNLNEEGCFILADICFSNKHSMEVCMEENIDKWDDSEIYILEDEIGRRLSLENIKYDYIQINSYTGVFIFMKN